MNLLGSERASSEILSQVILISLTVSGVGLITLSGMPMIYGLQDMINTNSAEQTFSLFGSSASRAIFGDLPLQEIEINLGGGTLSVEPDSPDKKSFIEVNSSDFNVRIPMGKITYRLGNRLVSYEGGGTWSKYPSGAPVMLSPPKFNYNGGTLTIPEISIRGNGSADGRGTTSVIFKKNGTQVLYPGTGYNRTNPTNKGGVVYVNITSDFYDAWADYAASLGYTKVSTNPATSTASIKLSSVPDTLGEDTSITNPITFKGLDPENPIPINNFSFRLVPYGDKIDWDIHASSGKKKLIYHIKGDVQDPGDQVDIKVGYQDDGPGYTDPAETWEGHNKLTLQGQPDNLYLDVNLLSNSTYLTYTQKNVGAGIDSISSGAFNSTGFSWGSSSQSQYTTQYKWSFNNSTESWGQSITFNNGGIVLMGLNTTDGNAYGSIYSKLSGGNKTAITLWTSPNFTWRNGTPASARLYFDWKVRTSRNANLSSFYFMLNKPDGTVSQISPTITFNSETGWLNSNTTISVNEFNLSGNYSLSISATLNTKTAAATIFIMEVGWDNPTIILNSTASGSSQLSDKSLYDITLHYIQLMVQGDEDISFYQGYVPGRQPSAESRMLVNYSSTKAPIYLYISQNNADVSIR